MESKLQVGIVAKQSQHSFDQTVERFLELLRTKRVLLFAIIDHSGEAAKIGISMRPTQLVIFGNPAAGTPLMLAQPSIAIDLPLKVLVSEDEGGLVWLSYNSPDYLLNRHDVPPELIGNISVVEALVTLAAE